MESGNDRRQALLATFASRPMTRRASICLLVALTACTSTGASPTTTAAAEPSTAGTASNTAVLTDSSCASEPTDSMSPGPFTLAVRNDSSSTANFELFRLEVTYDEFAAYYAEENEILQAGQPSRVSQGIGELPAATDVHQVLNVTPGGSGELEGDLSEGTYAVLCEQLNEAGDYAGIFSVGPFNVAA